MMRIFLLVLFLVMGLFSTEIVIADTVDPVFAQSCSANARGTSGSFPNACDGSYPAACGPTGDLLSCSDTNAETHATQNGDFAGVEISSFDSTVTNCDSITKVEVCYEWWELFGPATESCSIGVDANAGASYSTAATTCPSTSASPGITCVDVTSLESWSCTSFFDTTGTRAQAYMEASKAAGQGGAGDINFDALFFNVTYEPADETAPTITLNNPANDTWDLDGSATFTYTPEDGGGLDTCSLYIDDVLNQTDSTITSGVQTSFSTSFADGAYDWYVSCTDDSANTGSSETRLIKIDTTAPNINLESPADATTSTTSEVSYEYNVVDTQTTIDSCELIVNGTVRDTESSITEGVTQSFVFSLSNGFYEWSVNCTDANGFEGASSLRTITINSLEPGIVSDSADYILGETAFISGEQFSNNVAITINYTLPNSTVLSNTTISSGTGTFTDTIFFPLSYPVGTYSVFAYRTSDLLENASMSFDVNLPPTTLDVLDDFYSQGSEIEIRGLGFPESDTINITLTFNDSSQDSFLTNSNSSGGFLTAYNLSYSQATGLSNVLAFSTSITTINDTDVFTITERFASLLTDQTSYGRNDNVNIFGYNFTRLGLVDLRIYDNTTNTLGPDFPVNNSCDLNGDFTDIWNTNGFCNGDYRIEAHDLNNSFLNDTIYFTIEEFTQINDISLPVSGFTSTDSALIDVSLVNESDDLDEEMTIGGGSGPIIYYELNFTNAYGSNLIIDEVLLTLEHAETTGLSSPEVLLFDGVSYNTINCLGLGTSTTDRTDTCDIASEFSSSSELNSISLRFQLTKTAGGGQTSTLDFAELNITTSFEPSCTYFNGSSGGGISANPPTIETVLLEDNFVSPENELDLNAGTTKQILCNSTITDGDGFADIQSVNATLYSTTVSQNSPDDNQTHYTNTSCSLTNGVGNEANYTCSFDVYYYAINGTWECTVTALDSVESVSQFDVSTMNQLYALNVSQPTIDFGDFGLGQISPEQTINISNIGNAQIDVNSYAYGTTLNDGLSLDCTTGNISLSSQKYAINPGIDFSNKTASTPTLASIGLFMESQTTTGTAPTNTTFWQLEAPGPEGAQGTCNGQLVFQAES